ncbi:MAG: hypothetical protein ABWY16_07300 [Pedobacter sp.]|uniref:universal stress protein n=1 Tax=Pedobacter sp. TaxID=1411316 RepID=UPI00339617F8
MSATKKLLIPVDFSSTSNHTIDYAIALSRELEVSEIILLKNFHYTSFEILLPSPQFILPSRQDLADRKQENLTRLLELKTFYERIAGDSIKINTVFKEMPIETFVNSVIDDEQPDLMLIGTTIVDEPTDSYTFLNITELVRTSRISVLLIPDGTQYSAIKTALIPCNLKALTDIGILRHLNNIIPRSLSNLTLLYFDNSDDILEDARREKSLEIVGRQTLPDYKFNVYRSKKQDVIGTVGRYTRDLDVQLIIALPHAHNFLYNLTHKNLIRAISLDATVPVLVLKAF